MPKVAKVICFVMQIVILSGCMIFNPDKRTELTEMSYSGAVHITKPVVIDISKATGQIPVEEAVWTNKGGPYHIPEESHTIGVSQNYQFMPILGGATVVNTGSTLVVPFGRIFSETIKAAISQSTPATVCATPKCLEDFALKYPEYTRITLTIKDFRTWETPFNHINFESTVNLGCVAANSPMVVRSVTAAENDIALGMFRTSYGVTETMRDSAKNFGAKVVEVVLGESEACLSNRKEATQR